MRRLTITAAAALSSACGSITVTHTLGSLQEEFAELVRTEASCESSQRPDPECLGDFEAMYGSIEQQAGESVGVLSGSADAGDRQIAVGLHRLAAFAAVEARSGKAASHADAGRDLCTSLGNAAPPRDCALLKVVRRYEVLNGFVADVECVRRLGEAACDPSGLKLVDGFCPDVYVPMLESTAEAKSQPLLPRNVTVYLDNQVERARTTMRALSARLNEGVLPSQRPTSACQCLANRRGENCANLTPEGTKAICIVNSLEPAAGGRCPDAI